MSVTKKELDALIDKYENYAYQLEEKYSSGLTLNNAWVAEDNLLSDLLNDLYTLRDNNTKIKGCKKVLPNCAETRDYLNSLKPVYLIGCWAHYGVMQFPFSGKYADNDKTEPYVYYYDDHNGTCDNYYLTELHDTTTGYVWGWTFSKEDAIRIAEQLEHKAENQE